MPFMVNALRHENGRAAWSVAAILIGLAVPVTPPGIPVQHGGRQP